MRCIFDSPVLADRSRCGFGCDGAAGQIERDFATGLPASCGGQEMKDRALDPDDCRHMRLPFRPSDRLRGLEHGDGSGFVAIAPVLVDTPFARQGLGGRADGFDLVAQDRLIVLELNNQKGVGGGSDFKGFFARAWRRT